MALKSDDSPTIRAIDNIIKRLDDHPEYSKTLRNEVGGRLLLDAARHSESLEKAADRGRVDQFRPRSSPTRDKPKKHETYCNLREGWKLLESDGLNLTTLSRLGKIVEPKNNDYFRREAIQIGATELDFNGIEEMLDTMLWRMENLGLHPIKKAIESHLEIVNIHPYKDGNGRVARLVQDFTLDQHGYPAAKIDVSERVMYNRLIDKVRMDRLNHQSYINEPSDNEKIFHEYIAGRVLRSVQYIEDELRKRRMYGIKVKGRRVDERTIRSLMGSVRSRSRTSGIPVSIKMEREISETRGFTVIGDMDLNILKGVLDRRVAESNGISYDIGKVTGDYGKIILDDDDDDD